MRRASKNNGSFIHRLCAFIEGHLQPFHKFTDHIGTTSTLVPHSPNAAPAVTDLQTPRKLPLQLPLHPLDSSHRHIRPFADLPQH